MKQLWILNHYAQAPQGPGGTRHFSLAKYLLKEGWETSIIAGSTEHGSGRQRLDARQNVRIEDHDGVRFVWVRLPDYSGNGLARIRNMMAYAFRASNPVLLQAFPTPDAVIGSSVHPLAGVAASRLARRFGVPFIFEVRDLWPETLIAFGRISRHGLPAILLRALEKQLYRRAASIISVLPKASDYIANFGIEPEKIIWIPNGVDSSCFSPSPPPRGDKAFTFMYLGAHGQANSLTTLIEAARLIEKSEQAGKVRFRLIGSGPEKDALREMAQGLPSVFFENSVPACQVPEIASAAHAFVICARPVHGLYRYGISMNKLYDYMAAARPVVASLDAINNPIDDAGCGLTVPPDNPQALAQALVEVASMPPEERHLMGLAGRRHVEKHYDYRVLSGRLANLLESLGGELYRLFGKRLMDLALVIPGLVVLAPAIGLLALLVRIVMGSPVLFMQRRPGIQGKPFMLLKFRTMLDFREGDGTDLSDEQRLTRFGQFLRATSIDELPELINVLRGEMSLVGPRPLLMQYLGRYTEEQARRHEVRPGITGWAQVNGRNAISWEEKFDFDVWYVDHLSFWLDLKILGLTGWKVVRRDGVSAEGFATMPEFVGSDIESKGQGEQA